MAGSVVFCGYKDCTEQLDPKGKLFGLSEERGMNPRPVYCSAEHALMTREECYDVPKPALRRCW